MKRVSLADVARAAGVGKATASRALSGRDEVGEATRARIAEIAETMGYQPHRGAQALRTGRFGVLAISVPLDDDAAGDLLRSAASAAAARGYQLLVVAAEATGPSTSALRSLSVDGILVVGTDIGGLGVPTVTMSTADGDIPTRTAEAVALLLEHVETSAAAGR